MFVRTLTLFLLLLSGSVLFTAAQAVPAGIEEVYLAKDDGKGYAGDQSNEFRTTDVPIYCVVLLESGAKTTVKMTFVAVAVAGVRPETKVVTASYTTRDGENRVNFTGRPDNRWAAGKYRVDLFLDGKLAKGVEFDIKGPGGEVTTALKDRPAVRPKPRKQTTKN